MHWNYTFLQWLMKTKSCSLSRFPSCFVSVMTFFGGHEWFIDHRCSTSHFQILKKVESSRDKLEETLETLETESRNKPEENIPTWLRGATISRDKTNPSIVWCHASTLHTAEIRCRRFISELWTQMIWSSAHPHIPYILYHGRTRDGLADVVRSLVPE